MIRVVKHMVFWVLKLYALFQYELIYSENYRSMLLFHRGSLETLISRISAKGTCSTRLCVLAELNFLLSRDQSRALSLSAKKVENTPNYLCCGLLYLYGGIIFFVDNSTSHAIHTIMTSWRAMVEYSIWNIMVDSEDSNHSGTQVLRALRVNFGIGISADLSRRMSVLRVSSATFDIQRGHKSIHWNWFRIVHFIILWAQTKTDVIFTTPSSQRMMHRSSSAQQYISDAIISALHQCYTYEVISGDIWWNTSGVA